MKASLLERLTSKKSRLRRLKNNIVSYLSNLAQLSDEERAVLNYLKAHDIAVFPYDFVKEYDQDDIEVHFDPTFKLYYTIWEGKKLYHKKGSRIEKMKRYYNSLLLEQDIRSPHRYLTENFTVNDGDIIVDVGAAEGNFSLSVIEKAGHVYLFEPDKKWISALEATFNPWQNKVTIVSQMVSDVSNRNTTTIDNYFNDKPIHFIKADVEGAEIDLLKGAQQTIQRLKQLKIAVCTYHQQEHADILNNLLTGLEFNTNFSDGFMLYYYGRDNVVKPPYLRKAVLRAVKTPIN